MKSPRFPPWLRPLPGGRSKTTSGPMPPGPLKPAQLGADIRDRMQANLEAYLAEHGPGWDKVAPPVPEADTFEAFAAWWARQPEARPIVEVCYVAIADVERVVCWRARGAPKEVRAWWRPGSVWW